MNWTSINQLKNLSKNQNKKIYEIVIEDQMKCMNLSYDDIYCRMENSYNVMLESFSNSFKEKLDLKIEQSDGSKTYNNYVKNNKSIFGSNIGQVITVAMAIAEYNANMGKIVAAPTAGSCGILPACLMGIQQIYNIDKNKIVNSLFTASAVGMVISNVAYVAGAKGGCQAECGTASAMAAASIVEILDGDIDQIDNSIAISLQNVEGLVCDPVLGLVECPCIKRNASGAINALLAADLSLSGVKSVIPADEVILSMKQVGDMMDSRLKETAKGGLSISNTAKQLENNY